MSASSDNEKKENDHNLSDGKMKRRLDTFFPQTWLLLFMFILVLFFNLVTGIKLFTLEKEKEALKILQGQYEGYAELIEDIEQKTLRKMELTQEIVPLEVRRENAIADLKESTQTLEENRKEFDKIRALHNEIREELKANRETIAELSNQKKILREENEKLESLVARLKDSESRIIKGIEVRKEELQAIEGELNTTAIKLENQKKYLADVAVANSSFNEIREKFSVLSEKLAKTQEGAEVTLQKFEQTIGGIEDKNQKLAISNKALGQETKALSSSNDTIAKSLSTISENSNKIINEVNSINDTNKLLAESSQELNITVGKIEEDRNNLLQKIDSFGKINESLKTSMNSLSDTREKLASESNLLNTEVANLSGEIKAISESQSGLSQANKEFDKIIGVVGNQSGQFVKAVERISSIHALKEQLSAFPQILTAMAEAAKNLEQSSNAIQTEFQTELEAMNLSFDPLKQEVVSLEKKVDMLLEQFNKILSGLQEKDPNAPTTQ